MKTYLGIELGSTRIKGVLLDDHLQTVSSGAYEWNSSFENGVWTYALEDVWKGLRATLQEMESIDSVTAMGISGMMHGYFAFDRDWNLLVPFRTWQNTITGEAAEKLSALLNFNIPQRWSIAHLYQAVLNGEAHIERVAHITTLAGYVHYRLTGVNAVGVGEASGMFPIDSETCTFNAEMLDAFDALIEDMPWKIRDVLPQVLVAGDPAGALTEDGAALLGGCLRAGIRLVPPEGDAGTGMVATNAVAPRTGNVSAGTSIFSMVVLEKPLSAVYPELDMVTTPDGAPVAMVHCNNCTNDLNAWVRVIDESLDLFGAAVDRGTVYTKLFQKSLEGDADCGGLTVYNYLAGEPVTHFDAGRPLVVRSAESSFTLANFLRAQIYSTFATLCIGMEILQQEHVAIDSLTGHGGLFKTAGVAQKYLAAACRAPVSCMETAGEGGAYGMALLAAYPEKCMVGESLTAFLKNQVFVNAKNVVEYPDPVDADGFEAYCGRFRRGLAVEAAAVETL